MEQTTEFIDNKCITVACETQGSTQGKQGESLSSSSIEVVADDDTCLDKSTSSQVSPDRQAGIALNLLEPTDVDDNEDEGWTKIASPSSSFDEFGKSPAMKVDDIDHEFNANSKDKVVADDYTRTATSSQEFPDSQAGLPYSLPQPTDVNDAKDEVAADNNRRLDKSISSQQSPDGQDGLWDNSLHPTDVGEEINENVSQDLQQAYRHNKTFLETGLDGLKKLKGRFKHRSRKNLGDTLSSNAKSKQNLKKKELPIEQVVEHDCQQTVASKDRPGKKTRSMTRPHQKQKEPTSSPLSTSLHLTLKEKSNLHALFKPIEKPQTLLNVDAVAAVAVAPGALSVTDATNNQEPMNMSMLRTAATNIIEPVSHPTDFSSTTPKESKQITNVRDECLPLAHPTPTGLVAAAVTVPIPNPVKVRFTALLSPDFDYDLSRDRLFIICGHRNYGNWDTTEIRYEMTAIRTLDTGHIIFQHEAEFPKRLLAEEKFPYKYLVCRQGYGLFYEFLAHQYIRNKCYETEQSHMNGGFVYRTNRLLYVDEMTGATNVHEQFDGSIVPEKPFTCETDKSRQGVPQKYKEFTRWLLGPDPNSILNRRLNDAHVAAIWFVNWYPTLGFCLLDGRIIDTVEAVKACLRVRDLICYQFATESDYRHITNKIADYFATRASEWILEASRSRSALSDEIRIDVAIVSTFLLFTADQGRQIPGSKQTNLLSLCFLNLCELYQLSKLPTDLTEYYLMRKIYLRFSASIKQDFRDKLLALVESCKGNVEIVAVIPIIHGICSAVPLSDLQIGHTARLDTSWCPFHWPTYNQRDSTDLYMYKRFKHSLQKLFHRFSYYFLLYPQLYAYIAFNYCDTPADVTALLKSCNNACPFPIVLAKIGHLVNETKTEHASFAQELQNLLSDCYAVMMNSVLERYSGSPELLLSFIGRFETHSMHQISTKAGVPDWWVRVVCKYTRILLDYKRLDKDSRIATDLVKKFLNTSSNYLNHFAEGSKKLFDSKKEIVQLIGGGRFLECLSHTLNRIQEGFATWSMLLNAVHEHPSFLSEQWEILVLDRVQVFYQKEPANFLVFLCLQTFEDFAPHIGNVMHCQLEEVVDSLSAAGSTLALATAATRKPAVFELLAERLSRTFAACVTRNPADLLGLILHDPIINFVLQYCAEHASSLKWIANKPYTSDIQAARQILRQAEENCYSRHISFGKLELIATNFDQFTRMLGYQNSSCNVESLKNQINSLMKVKHDFEDFIAQLMDWQHLVGEHAGRFDDIDLVNRLLTSGNSDMIFANVTEPREDGTFYLKYCVLPPPFMEFLIQIPHLQNCHIYCFHLARLLTEQAKRSSRISFTEFAIEVHIDARVHVKHLTEALLSGDIRSNDMNHLLQQFTFAELHDDFSTIAHYAQIPDVSHLATRINQLRQYDVVRKHAHVAASLMQLAQQLHLDVVQRELRPLVEQLEGHSDVRLNDITDVMDAGSTHLSTYSEVGIKALEAFVHAQELIDWIRGKQSLVDSDKRRRDVKTFIDTATAGAMANDLHFALLTNFQRVVTSYSSLIFCLSDTTGFVEFATYIAETQAHAEAEANLPTTLLNLRSKLSWFQELWSNQGEFEYQVMQELTQFMQTGKFIVACTEANLNETLDDVVFAEMQETDGKTKRMSLPELTELHNKLTLIGRQIESQKETKAIINQYLNIHEAILVLGNLCLKHEQAGNTFFSDCTFKFFCNNDAPKQALAEFKLSFNENEVVESKPCDHVLIHIRELNTLLDAWLKEWTKHFARIRSHYPVLNYFTNRQVVRMQKQFDGMRQKEGSIGIALQPKLGMLLMDVKPDIIHSDITTVLDEVLNVNEHHDRFGQSRRTKEHEVSITSSISAAQFLEHLKSNLSVSLAEKWAQFLDRHRTSTCLRMLSVESLGEALSKLHEKSAMPRQCIQFPEWLKNETNFLIVPQLSMVDTALACYIQCTPSGLPHSSEFLLCAPWTKFENIELFMHRVIQCPVERLFTLLAVDRLEAHVANNVVKFMEEFVFPARRKARLLVVCSSEGVQCMIAANLMRFAVTIPQAALVQRKAIVAFVQEKLIKPTIENQSNKEIICGKYAMTFVTSAGYGQGKSLHIKRIKEQLQMAYRGELKYVKVPIHGREADMDVLLKLLDGHEKNPTYSRQRLIHIDIVNHLTHGVDEMLLRLFLGCLEDRHGNVWKRLPCDNYVIEMSSTEAAMMDAFEHKDPSFRYNLPIALCHDPFKSVKVLGNTDAFPSVYTNQGADAQILNTVPFQRCAQYLVKRSENSLKTFFFDQNTLLHTGLVLNTLLMTCGAEYSWSELTNFVRFLDHQLFKTECNPFCQEGILPGLKSLCVELMLKMSHDFATHSLKISEDVTTLSHQNFDDYDVYRVAAKHRWEANPHPYILFNADGETFSFYGCHFDLAGNLLEPIKGEIIERNLISRVLLQNLKQQPDVQKLFTTKITDYNRQDLLRMLHKVLGTDVDTSSTKPPKTWIPHDPDPLYELTPDCVLKLFAIEMRTRTDIPVVIMGETGCGKTRLVKYLCELKLHGARLKSQNLTDKAVSTTADAISAAAPSSLQSTPLRTHQELQNLIIEKMHSGIGEQKLYEIIQRALEIGKQNYPRGMETFLFFDEANASPLISLIKEVMVDGTFNGEDVDLRKYNVHVIAALNPYRKHNDKVIQKLREAGLGYLDESKTSKSQESYANVKLRELVYRVHPLPPSLTPLVWDFGQLTDATEKMYISRMVASFMLRNGILQFNENMQNVLTNVIAAAQRFMKAQGDECSFVSLRDIERVLSVLKWFFDRRKFLYKEMDAELLAKLESYQACSDEARSVVLSIATCYRCSLLENRQGFDRAIAEQFDTYLTLPDGWKSIEADINACQNVFLREAQLEPNIAKNKALKENFFMMVIAVELGIPLFVVGRPGSSKTLSKTILAKSLEGASSRSEFFRQLKEAKIITFQCSPSSKAEYVEDVFKQCAKLQRARKNNLDQHAAVAVFDEIGLAEDSPDRPLKALHGLLEEGCPINQEKLESYHKVAFIGISNWALDPANMNRGIFITRPLPTDEELEMTAEAICSDNATVYSHMYPLIKPLTRAYLKIYSSQEKNFEFFGLRDFYSTLKAIYAITLKARRLPKWNELLGCVMHNFGGLKDKKVMNTFENALTACVQRGYLAHVNVMQLIRENLMSRHGNGHESRYLLVLTENCSATLTILKRQALLQDAEVIFGSCFSQDADYSLLCRNMNRIKVAMSKGRTVILLNLEDLYESLYELLNQSLVDYGGVRLVEIGLGTHRVKCSVHNDFKLVVVANYKFARKRFPIALINRLEKHYLIVGSDLADKQKAQLDELITWVEQFSTPDCAGQMLQRTAKNCFVGYTKDTLALLMSAVAEQLGDNELELMNAIKSLLLFCATPDSIIRSYTSSLPEEEKMFCKTTYFAQQEHTNMKQLLGSLRDSHLQLVTTYGALLSERDVSQISTHLSKNIFTFDLHKYSSEQQFTTDLQQFIQGLTESAILVVQCYYTCAEHQRLVDFARHRLEDIYTHSSEENQATISIIILVSLSNSVGAAFMSFPGTSWHCFHIDCLFGNGTAYEQLLEKPLSYILESLHGSYSDHFVNLQTVLKDACYGAGPQVSDWGTETLKRVELVCGLLDSDKAFFNVVMQHLISIQKSKESTMDFALGWLERQASNADLLLETKTFAEAVHKQMVRELVPLFAAFLAAIDVGHNIDLLKHGWQRELGLNLLQDVNFLDLSYNETSETFFERKEGGLFPRTQFKLRHTFERFAAVFPFSWLLKSKFSDILTRMMGDNDEVDPDTADAILETLAKLPWASSLTDRWTEAELIRCYTTDLITTNLNPTDEHFVTLCCEYIENDIAVAGNGEFGYLAVHVSYLRLHAPVQHFHVLYLSSLYLSTFSTSPSLPAQLATDRAILEENDWQVPWIAADKIVDVWLMWKFVDVASYNTWFQSIEVARTAMEKLLELGSVNDDVDPNYVNCIRIKWINIKLAVHFLQWCNIHVNNLNVIGTIVKWLESKPGLETVEFIERAESFTRQRLNIDMDCFVELVGKFVLHDSLAISRPVIEKLFSYVTNPNWATAHLRAGLFQQIYKKGSANYVRSLADEFLEQKHNSDQSGVAFVRTVLMCFDDEFSFWLSKDPTLHMRLLEDYFKKIEQCERITVDFIAATAAARAVFAFVAASSKKLLHPSEEDVIFGKIIQLAREFLSNYKDEKQPVYFFIRRLYEAVGLDGLKELSANDATNWAIPPELRIYDDTTVDYALIYGMPYKNIKEIILRSFVEGKPRSMLQPLETADQWKTSWGPMHSVIAAFNLRNKLGKARNETFETLATLLQSSSVDRLSVLVTTRVINGIEQNCETHLAGLLVHMLSATTAFPDATFMQFYAMCVHRLGNIKNWYFPSMPFCPIIEQLAEAKMIHEHRNTKVYFCEEGHPYFIQDCGEPNRPGTCTECKSPIGGVSMHVLVPGNKAMNSANIDDINQAYCCARTDTTFATQRQLTRLGTLSVRLLTEVALIGSIALDETFHRDALRHIRDSDTPLSYLMNHWQRDIAYLQQELNLSMDNCFVYLHVLLKQIASTFLTDVSFDELNETRLRDAWEAHFYSAVLLPVQEVIATEIQNVTRELENENQNRVLLDVVNGTLAVAASMETTLWGDFPKTDISSLMAVLRRQLGATRSNATSVSVVLTAFVDQNHLLQALRFLPDVWKLLETLRNNFRGYVDVAQAHHQTVAEYIASLGEPDMSAVKRLFDSYFQAWKLLQPYLTQKNFLLPISHGNKSVCLPGYAVPNVNNWEDNALALCMPLVCGSGLGACALLSHLISIENDFVEVLRANLPDIFPDRSPIHPESVTNAQIVAYSPEIELRAALLYSRTIVDNEEQETFDLDQLLNRLKRNVFHCAARIEQAIPEILPQQQRIAHCITALKSSVQQVEVSLKVVTALSHTSEKPLQPSAIKAILDAVELVLGFSVSLISTDRNQNLNVLVQQLKRVDLPVFVQDILKECGVNQLYSLWRLLSFERRLALFTSSKDSSKDVFPELEHDCRKPLPDVIKEQLSSDQLPKNVVMQLLYDITELLLIHVPYAVSEETAMMANQPLSMHLEFKVRDNAIWAEFLPEDVNFGCAVAVWNLLALRVYNVSPQSDSSVEEEMTDSDSDCSFVRLD